MRGKGSKNLQLLIRERRAKVAKKANLQFEKEKFFSSLCGSSKQPVSLPPSVLSREHAQVWGPAVLITVFLIASDETLY